MDRLDGEHNLSPEFLYTSDASPVQFGSLYQISKYLRSVIGHDKVRLNRAYAELKEYEKTSALGTHAGRRKRRRGQHHYNILPHKDEFFEMDLMDVYGKRGKDDNRLRRLNEGYVYLPFVLNGGTKYLYFRKLKWLVHLAIFSNMISELTDNR